MKRMIACLLLIAGFLGAADSAAASPPRVYRPYRPYYVPPAQYYYMPRPVYIPPVYVPPVAPVVPAWQYSYWYGYPPYTPYIYSQPTFYYWWRIR